LLDKLEVEYVEKRGVYSQSGGKSRALCSSSIMCRVGQVDRLGRRGRQSLAHRVISYEVLLSSPVAQRGLAHPLVRRQVHVTTVPNGDRQYSRRCVDAMRMMRPRDRFINNHSARELVQRGSWKSLLDGHNGPRMFSVPESWSLDATVHWLNPYLPYGSS
jgi:hypothetical protein